MATKGMKVKDLARELRVTWQVLIDLCRLGKSKSARRAKREGVKAESFYGVSICVGGWCGVYECRPLAGVFRPAWGVIDPA